MKFILAVVGILWSNVEVLAQNSDDAHRDVRRSLVFIEHRYEDNAGRTFVEQSTGFLISRNGHVVTTAHSLQLPAEYNPGSQEIYAIIGATQGSKVRATGIVKMDERLDFAILDLPSLAEPYSELTLPCETPTRGDNFSDLMLTSGFPLGQSYFVSEGKITSRDGPRGTFGFSADISSGQSGSPVYDQNGALKGLIVGGIRKNKNFPSSVIVNGLNYFLPLAFIYNDLRGFSTKQNQNCGGRPNDDQASLWGAASTSNSIELFRLYLERYPNGIFLRQANEAISQLDAEAWRIAWETDTRDSYQQYLRVFPTGIAKDEAQIALLGSRFDHNYTEIASNLQSIMLREGCYNGKIDGLFGRQSESAYQKLSLIISDMCNSLPNVTALSSREAVGSEWTSEAASAISTLNLCLDRSASPICRATSDLDLSGFSCDVMSFGNSNIARLRENLISNLFPELDCGIGQHWVNNFQSYHLSDQSQSGTRSAPSWFAINPTVLYYSSGNQGKASNLADLLTDYTGQNFETSRGGGLMVNPNWSGRAFIIHLR